MSQTGELSYLKDRLKGPIITEIIDPKDFSTEDILKSYFREILWLAGRYARPTVEYEDLVVEGLVGLLDAINRFDIEKAKGNKRAFHNLAVVRIKSYMFEFFLRNNSKYQIPNYMARAMTLLDQMRAMIRAQGFEDDLTPIQVYEVPEFEASCSPDFFRRFSEVKSKLKSLAENSDKTYEEMVKAVLKAEKNIQDFEATEEEEFEVSPDTIAEQREFLDRFLSNLKPQAREVLQKRLEGKTLEETGGEMGLTRERARQIEEQALSYLRRTPMYRDAHE